MQKDQKNISFPLIYGIVATIIFFVLLFGAIKQSSFEKNAITTTGKIVDYKKISTNFSGSDFRTHERYQPIVKFTDKNNKEVSFTTTIGDYDTGAESEICEKKRCINTLAEAKVNYPVGTELKVYYEEKSPEKAQAVDPHFNKLGKLTLENPITIIALVIIPISVLFSFFVVVKRLRSKK